MPSGHEFNVRTPVYPTAADSLEKPPGLVNHSSLSFNVICRFFEQLRDHPTKRRELLVKMFEARRASRSYARRYSMSDRYDDTSYSELMLDQTCTLSSGCFYLT